MTKANKDRREETPNLIAHYRPLRLKAVVAATTVRGNCPDKLNDAKGQEMCGWGRDFPEPYFSD